MWEDPIVAEVRNAREKLAAKYKHNLDAIITAARKQERTSGHPVVSPPRRQKAK
jgi:hypothetical protein